MDKENINNQNNEKEEASVLDHSNDSSESQQNKSDEEFCPSIFDKPDNKQDEPKNNKKKISKEVRNIIVISAICIGLALSAFAIFKFIPQKSDNVESSVFSNSDGEAKYIFDYSSYASSFDDTDTLTLGGISNIAVKNGTSEFLLTPSKSTEKQFNSVTYQEEEVEVIVWTIAKSTGQDITNVKFSNTYLNFLIGDVLQIAYKSIHTENKDATIPQNEKMTYSQECGLDKPAAEITVTFNENSSYKVNLGNKTPTDNEYFLSIDAKPSDSDKLGKPEINNNIYRVGSDVVAYFYKEPIYYVERNLFECPEDTSTTDEDGNEINDKYFTEGQLTGFDSIDISGSNFASPISFKTCDPTYPSYTSMYMMKSPFEKNCDSVAIDKLLAPIASGIAAKEALTMIATESDKSKFGINNPVCKVNYVIKNKTYILTVGEKIDSQILTDTANSEENSEYYSVMVNDNPSLYVISLSDIGFINMKAEDYFTKDIYSCSIAFVDKLSVKVGSGETKEFFLTHPPVEENVSRPDTDVSVMLGSKPIDQSAFKNFYQNIISTTAVEFTNNGKDSSSPALTLTFTYNNKSTPDVMKFSEYGGSQRRFFCSVNGKGYSLVPSSTVESLISQFESLAK